MRSMGLALLTAAAACAQSRIDPARIPALVKLFDPQPGEHALRCDAGPLKPALNFSFRFQGGFLVHVPMDQYEGPGHGWTVLTRVTPEGGDHKPVYLITRVRLPNVPKTKIELQFAGVFLLGEGRYSVRWMMLDETGRVCRQNWLTEAKLTHAERKVQVAMAPETVAEIWARNRHDQHPPPPDAAPMRVTVLLHAAPLSPRRVVLNGRDQAMLVGTLSSLLERLPARSVRLVMFNLEQQRILYHEETFTLDGLDQVAQSLNNIQLGRVDVKVLENAHGHQELLAEMLNAELAAQPQSDAVVLLGPRSRFMDRLQHDLLERPQGAAPHFYYLQIRPFFMSGSTVPDTISHAVARLHGKTVSINTPGEFAKAIEQVNRR
jgi:hypothetical protein